MSEALIKGFSNTNVQLKPGSACSNRLLAPVPQLLIYRYETGLKDAQLNMFPGDFDVEGPGRT